jgi:hypothetical protein
MVEIEPTTIKMTGAKSSKLDRVPKNAHKEQTGWAVLRVVGITLAMSLCFGWGAWQYMGVPRQLVDEECIADLEGFESAPQFTKSRALSDSHSAQLGDAGSLPPVPDQESLALMDSPSLTPPATDEITDSDTVWLTGTIEEAETLEKMDFPERISGGRSDSLFLR